MRVLRPQVEELNKKFPKPEQAMDKQKATMELYRKAGVADPDAAIVFFHGLGLSHMDVEQGTADWRFEAGMVVPLHMVYPRGESSRAWLEEVVLVTERGSEPFFGWGYEPLLA
jgi:Xaa-Pro aminopeptidase